MRLRDLPSRLGALFRRASTDSESEATAGQQPDEQRFVRVVTDSTSCLSTAEARALGAVVVPLSVITDDGELYEGEAGVAESIASRLALGERMTTSQPSPADFSAAFSVAANEGALGIVSVHLSGEISGTCASAASAGQRSAVPVRTVESGTSGSALGDAVRAAARCAAAGQDAEHVAARAREVAASSTTLMVVDSLEYLRRGGRLSATSAAFGAALGVRPILHFDDGKVMLLQRVRTRRLALDRIVTLARQATEACVRPVVTVQHVGALERAEGAAKALEGLIGSPVRVLAASSVLAVHVGPGAIAVSVADLGDHPH